MPLTSSSFLHLGFVEILDILFVAIILYWVFRWFRGTSAINILIAIIILLLIRIVAVATGMELLSTLMGTVLDVGAIAIVVIFQPEIRRFLNRMGSRTEAGKSFLNKILRRSEQSIGTLSITEIGEACKEMSAQKVGALIVLPNNDSLEEIIESGDRVDAIISKRLILNIFFKNSPLHDGAMIISSDRIVAARCTLPITDRSDIPANLGLRHKAAIGISEKTDASVVVVSEETGNISFVREGIVTPVTSINRLKLYIGNSNEHTQQAGK